MRAAFNLFDKDGGGTIEAAEIASVLGYDMERNAEAFQDMVREIDINGDGQIDFNEFKQMLLRVADNKNGEPTFDATGENPDKVSLARARSNMREKRRKAKEAEAAGSDDGEAARH